MTDKTIMLTDQMVKKLNPNNDTRIYIAKEVTFDYSTSAFRIDIVMFKPKNNTAGGIEQGEFYCYEVKSSVEDFHSKHGHNFIGDRNYYVMPSDVYEKVKHLIPWNIGVYIFNDKTMECIKKAHVVTRIRPCSEILLMMFRSANRENIKIITVKTFIS